MRIYTRLTLRKCLWGLFLMLSVAVGIWGILHHPWYKERLYASMTLSRLLHLKAQSPDDPVLLYYLGKRLNEQSRETEAMPVLQHAAIIDGSSPRIREEWAHAQVASGNLLEAHEQLLEFVKDHPGSAQGRLLLGKLYLSEQYESRAQTELEQAAHLEPTSGEIWYFLARARFTADSCAAREAIQKSVALIPD